MQSTNVKFNFADTAEEEWLADEVYQQLGLEAGVYNGWRWVLAEGPRVEAYLVPSRVASSLERLWNSRMPYSLGLFAGVVQGRKLNVSLELASHFGKNIRAEKLVLLKVEAEQPILYGHDVLAGSILKISADAGKDELVVLANSSREILALGRLLTDASAIKHFVPTQRVIRNLIDKGWYLRKGG